MIKDDFEGDCSASFVRKWWEADRHARKSGSGGGLKRKVSNFFLNFSEECCRKLLSSMPVRFASLRANDYYCIGK